VVASVEGAAAAADAAAAVVVVDVVLSRRRRAAEEEEEHERRKARAPRTREAGVMVAVVAASLRGAARRVGVRRGAWLVEWGLLATSPGRACRIVLNIDQEHTPRKGGGGDGGETEKR